MPDDYASDEQLIEDAHKAVERLKSAAWDHDPLGSELLADEAAADAAITALGKRLEQLREERQAARDALAVVRVCANDVVSAGQEITARIRLELGTMERPEHLTGDRHEHR